ncbi:hypothetical protein COP1_020241 [Malus domestica]
MFFNHVTSQQVVAMERYSASALECDTVVCFLVFQDTGACPSKMQYPVIDLLVSLQRAQSASQNARNWSDPVDGSRMP